MEKVAKLLFCQERNQNKDNRNEDEKRIDVIKDWLFKLRTQLKTVGSFGIWNATMLNGINGWGWWRRRWWSMIRHIESILHNQLLMCSFFVLQKNYYYNKSHLHFHSLKRTIDDKICYNLRTNYKFEDPHTIINISQTLHSEYGKHLDEGALLFQLLFSSSNFHSVADSSMPC